MGLMLTSTHRRLMREYKADAIEYHAERIRNLCESQERQIRTLASFYKVRLDCHRMGEPE